MLSSNNRGLLILVFSILIGTLAGIAAHVLRSSVFYVRNLLFSDFEFHYKNYLLIILPIIGIALTLLFRKYILGSDVKHNIPALLYSISKKKGKVNAHKSYSSIIGAVLTAGFGGSVGLESPIISSGAAIGSKIAHWLKLDYKTNILFLACGTAGGIAAIFNTPIAAIIFVLEVLLIDLTRFSLIPLLLASTSGAITTKILSHSQVLFDFRTIAPFHIADIAFYIFLGIIAASVSIYFTKVFLNIEGKMQSTSVFKSFAIGSILVGILLFLFPPLWGEGFEVIKTLFNENENQLLNNTLFENISYKKIALFGFLFSLMIFKVISTSLTINAGGVGGIFAPALFTGAILGYLVAELINLMGIFHSIPTINFVMVGMAAVLAGVLHAPLTSIFLIAELTGGYELIVPLMIASTISYISTKIFIPHGIITVQLAHRGELLTHNKDKSVLVLMNMDSLIEVDFKAVYEGETLADLVKAVAQSKRNLFPVLNKNNKLRGVILLDNIREIMFDTSSYNSAIEDFMIIPPAIIHSTDTMQEVMDKFEKTKAWNLPLIEDGKYLGFISKSRIFNVYREWLLKISDD